MFSRRKCVTNFI